MKEGSKVPRRGNVPKREVLPDPVYNSVLVTKLVNSIMLDGKKGVAQKRRLWRLRDRRDQDRQGTVWKLSSRLWKTSCLPWKSRPAVSAAPPIRCLMEVRPGAPSDPRPALADRLFPHAQREDHERAPRRRDHGRLQQHRRLCEEARRYPQDGRSQQGILPIIRW